MSIAAATLIGAGLSAGVGYLGRRHDNKTRLHGIRKQNRSNQLLARQQRDWNEEMWKAQNAWNLPSQQMKRFKDAGLNPHLIYGQGNPGNASDVKGYSRAEAKSEREGWDTFSGMADPIQTGLNQIHVQAQTTKLNQDSANVAQDTLNKTIEGQRKAQDLGLESQTFESRVQKAKANADKAVTDAQISATKSQTEELMQNPRVEKAIQQVLNLEKQYEGQGLANQLKKIVLQLKDIGINENDPAWARILIQGLHKMDGVFNFLPGPTQRLIKLKLNKQQK